MHSVSHSQRLYPARSHASALVLETTHRSSVSCVMQVLSLEDTLKANISHQASILEWRSSPLPGHRLAADTFAAAPQILEVLLSNVSIATLDKHAFRGSRLESIIIDANDDSLSLELPEQVFRGLPLTRLNIRNSGLSSLPGTVFANLTKLKRLNLVCIMYIRHVNTQ